MRVLGVDMEESPWRKRCGHGMRVGHGFKSLEKGCKAQEGTSYNNSVWT
jgi:hypothetical protein